MAEIPDGSEGMNKECAACGGKCCRVFIFMPKQNLDADMLELWKVRGAQEEADFLLVPCACPRFNKEVGVCLRYEDRPAACRKFEVGSVHCLMARQFKC